MDPCTLTHPQVPRTAPSINSSRKPWKSVVTFSAEGRETLWEKSIREKVALEVRKIQLLMQMPQIQGLWPRFPHP